MSSDTPRTDACDICGTFDPKCQREDCRYRCDPVLSDWDAELVETQGRQFPEILSAPRVDELLATADAERWTEADILAELEPLARTLERELRAYKRDGYVRVPVEKLESIRIFARDCIDTGHDRGALGNLYAIVDLCDAMLSARPSD